jgi:hypothetical protein
MPADVALESSMAKLDKGLKKDESANYGNVLQKLLPVEITAAYLALRTPFVAIGLSDTGILALLALFAIALVIIFFFVLERGFGVRSRLHRFFYCGCFLVWAANIEVDKLGGNYLNSDQGKVLTLIVGGITILVSFGVPFYLPRKRLVKA